MRRGFCDIARGMRRAVSSGMSKAIEVEILKALSAGREIDSERILGESFASLLDKRMVAFDGHEPVIMPAGRSYLAEQERVAAVRRRKNNASRRAHSDTMRSLGMRRNLDGTWE